jgi:Tfp pilus assembly protein PilF
MAAVKRKSRTSDLWIIGAWQDLALFVLSPVWVIPLLWLAKSRFDANGFGAALLAIGATGHHLPGFIRAYTDPSLFRRFRTRFIAAPLFFLAVYVAFFTLHLESLKLILILWGTWHGAMQVNGFLRIYDAKAKSFSAVTSWLDRLMCLAWFGGALLYSARLVSVFSHLFNAGGGAIAPGAFVAFRQAWMALMVGVTAAFAVNAWQKVRAGSAPSPVKLLLMASSVALWWFAMIEVNSVLVGLLLFEIVHDLQYNALVWVYNKRRVSEGMTASKVEKFLFQPRVWRAVFYVALIAAYGSIADVFGYANVQAPSALQVGVNAVSFWTGLFMVSTFLHFYFDGFIWQVRDTNFREGLGIGGRGASTPQAVRSSSRWLVPGWKWAFFLVPAAVLGFSEYRRPVMPLIEQARNVAELLPNRWQSNAVLGSLETSSGDDAQALLHLERAVALNPEYSYGEAMLGDIYSRRADIDRAVQHYTRAVTLNPENYDVQSRFGKLLVNTGRIREAIPHLQAAAERGTMDAELAYVLGASLVQEKRTLEGIPYLQRAVQLDPLQKQAFNFLGIALQTQGDLRSAAQYYRRALEIDPSYLYARENLDRIERGVRP